MSTLKKHELILAQKAISARQVRIQSSAIKDELQTMKSKHANVHRASTASLQGSTDRQMSKSSSLPSLGTSEFSPKATYAAGSMLMSPKDTHPLPSPSQAQSFEMEKKVSYFFIAILACIN
ncbi:MAG: hypothetical protein EOP48_33100 [Sphingobacteriales bacterium]|nr:MAG: hypothetical protein EOP48_33100 [Sphingobacteriales bacterium]